METENHSVDETVPKEENKMLLMFLETLLWLKQKYHNMALVNCP